MPFASAPLFQAAAGLLKEERADVVIARAEPRGERAGWSGEGYEPLHAVYRRAACLPAIESAIEADQWKVIAWFPQVKVRVLTPEEIGRYDPSGLAFWNVNTPEEFSKAESMALPKDTGTV
jgi:molybdopterin-guanine dinucleotide biosynthesis protein A